MKSLYINIAYTYEMYGSRLKYRTAIWYQTNDMEWSMFLATVTFPCDSNTEMVRDVQAFVLRYLGKEKSYFATIGVNDISI